MVNFCPNCSSILSRKKISGQIHEYCNCPDKTEPKEAATVIIKRTQRRKTIIKRTGQKKNSSRQFITIEESSHKTVRESSKYSLLDLNLKLDKHSTLPAIMLTGEISKRLSKAINNLYERFYRKIEDFFSSSELQFVLLLKPNRTLTDFVPTQWGLATFTQKHDLLLWYRGTKLNDRASWEAKVIEKREDLFLPFQTLFPKDFKKPRLNFDHIRLQELCKILLRTWDTYKDITKKKFYKPDFPSLYNQFKDRVDNKDKIQP